MTRKSTQGPTEDQPDLMTTSSEPETIEIEKPKIITHPHTTIVNPPALSESAELLRMAIANNLDTDKLKALMDLRDREEAHRAQQLFDQHFADMQKEYVPAIKTKDVSTNGSKVYSYCPLPEILKVYAPILSRHGFTYRWEEKVFGDGKERETTCYISGYGHTKTASIVLPVADQNKMANAIQARGITAEYGRRYSFLNATGCIVADEESDPDGKLPEEKPEELKKQIANLLTFIPKSLHSAVAPNYEKSDIKELNFIFTDTQRVRTRCQNLLAATYKKAEQAKQGNGNKARQEMFERLAKIVNLDQLLDLEAFVENL